MGIEVKPVSGALGAEIRGIDLRDLDDGTFELVRDALHEFEVVFFREVWLSEDEHMALAQRFGALNVFPMSRLLGATEPKFQVITDGPDGKPEADDWHTDLTWTETPPKYALLHGQVIPHRGGWRAGCARRTRRSCTHSCARIPIPAGVCCSSAAVSCGASPA